MYKGIGKFITPDDQIKVMDLLDSAKTLGPDGAQLILEDIDRRVPKGRGFDFDGIMWSNKDNEFAAIDVYATPGDVPEDWPGLIAPPFQFPIKATYLVGRTHNWAWYGSAINIGIHVCQAGDETQLVSSNSLMYQELSDLVRKPEKIIHHFAGNNNPVKFTEIQNDGGEGKTSLRQYKWESSDHNQTVILIGNWPFNLENNPQGDCLLIEKWETPQNTKMWIAHLYVWLMEPDKYTLMESPKDLFTTYSFFKGIKQFGLFEDNDNSSTYIKWKPK